jgi:hypothetical protein
MMALDKESHKRILDMDGSFVACFVCHLDYYRTSDYR